MLQKLDLEDTDSIKEIIGQQTDKIYGYGSYFWLNCSCSVHCMPCCSIAVLQILWKMLKGCIPVVLYQLNSAVELHFVWAHLHLHCKLFQLMCLWYLGLCILIINCLSGRYISHSYLKCSMLQDLTLPRYFKVYILYVHKTCDQARKAGVKINRKVNALYSTCHCMFYIQYRRRAHDTEMVELYSTLKCSLLLEDQDQEYDFHSISIDTALGYITV